MTFIITHYDKLYFFYSIHNIPTKQERYEANKEKKSGAKQLAANERGSGQINEQYFLVLDCYHFFPHYKNFKFKFKILIRFFFFFFYKKTDLSPLT
jgi:hypothetical protein